MDQPYLLTFSAHTSEALRMVFQSHESYLTAHPDSLLDLSYTLTARREALGHRAFSVVQKTSIPKGLEVSQFHKCQVNPLAAWVFTGQGAQWARMGASLILKNDRFKRSIELLEMELQNCHPRLKWSLIGGFRQSFCRLVPRDLDPMTDLYFDLQKKYSSLPRKAAYQRLNSHSQFAQLYKWHSSMSSRAGPFGPRPLSAIPVVKSPRLMPAA